MNEELKGLVRNEIYGKSLNNVSDWLRSPKSKSETRASYIKPKEVDDAVVKSVVDYSDYKKKFDECESLKEEIELLKGANECTKGDVELYEVLKTLKHEIEHLRCDIASLEMYVKSRDYSRPSLIDPYNPSIQPVIYNNDNRFNLSCDDNAISPITANCSDYCQNANSKKVVYRPKK